MVHLDQDFQSWRESLNPSLARRLDKQTKRLRSRGGANLRQVQDVDELDPILQELGRFRAGRFGERGGTDLFQEPDFFEFYRQVAYDSISQGGPGKLNVLEVGGKPAAIALDLMHEDRELYLIVGYDFEGMRTFSLGLIIVDQIACEVIDRGLRYLDLTVGDEPYKTDFGARRSPLFHVHSTRTPIGFAAFHGNALYLAARRRAGQARSAWRRWQRKRSHRQRFR